MGKLVGIRKKILSLIGGALVAFLVTQLEGVGVDLDEDQASALTEWVVALLSGVVTAAYGWLTADRVDRASEAAEKAAGAKR